MEAGNALPTLIPEPELRPHPQGHAQIRLRTADTTIARGVLVRTGTPFAAISQDLAEDPFPPNDWQGERAERNERISLSSESEKRQPLNPAYVARGSPARME